MLDDEVGRERRMRWVLRALRCPCVAQFHGGMRVSVRLFSLLTVNDVVSIVTYSVIRCPDDDDDGDDDEDHHHHLLPSWHFGRTGRGRTA